MVSLGKRSFLTSPSKTLFTTGIYDDKVKQPLGPQLLMLDSQFYQSLTVGSLGKNLGNQIKTFGRKSPLLLPCLPSCIGRRRRRRCAPRDPPSIPELFPIIP
jgi:hypothetical protein